MLLYKSSLALLPREAQIEDGKIEKPLGQTRVVLRLIEAAVGAIIGGAIATSITGKLEGTKTTIIAILVMTLLFLIIVPTIERILNKHRNR